MWKLDKPVGLAAGILKNGENIDRYDDGEFGYVVLGTVTRSPREGNPEPNILYLKDQENIVNSLGIPNNGIIPLARALYDDKKEYKVKLVVSITGANIADITYCHALVEPDVDAIELNISCPNVEGFDILGDKKTIRTILDFLAQFKQKPIFVKLPRTYNILETIDYLRDVIDGVTLANSAPTIEPSFSNHNAGLSGKHLYVSTLHLVKKVRAEFDDLYINACGGINKENYQEVLDAGANTVQYLTSYIYDKMEEHNVSR